MMLLETLKHVPKIKKRCCVFKEKNLPLTLHVPILIFVVPKIHV